MLKITWDEDEIIALAVSTGIDSMALLHMLNTTYRNTYRKLICLHVNHGLREASNEEAAFIKKYCEEHNIELYIKNLDLSEIVKQNKSIQEASRKYRYAWFDEMMTETSGDVLLTAHHIDDQKETIAYRLFSGRIGRASLGIEVEQTRQSYRIVRPLLHISKSEIAQYQQISGFEYYEDVTNKDTKYTRNYIRNEVLPTIQKREELSTNHLLDLNDWVDDARKLIKEQASQFIKNEVLLENEANIKRDVFNNLNQLVKVQVLDELVDKYVGRRFSMKAYQEWLSIFANDTKQSVIPVSDNWQFVVAYDKLLLCEEIEFDINSTFIEAFEQCVFDKWLIETKNIDKSLLVRTRLTGDRIQYYNRGNKHHKKVNRIMIDNKLDIHKRDTCPIIVNGKDIIAVGDIWMDSNFKNLLTITYIGDDFNERFD
ncbi:tRNA lysidine(34) synthetase TilS [Mammaliicoccus stepanovicii]|uniref:tRNA(Ile)-lysidine synthase n=1 Tax=Mammaliicoccus stepanovicii TaxID=643214 RepID=A0A240ACB7_9STAP|nr:tRNA lysidine(34) synthetase TilS [Mammaliicoccus stepanovicii]PNZ79086.1 tRNA lysidine(34) synthetase TilS [Mammaliicoccus stepanovicii]GGI43288.1 tRNA(Ile)-lysidine synthase [Mammaliicoccus stepanovicii]SNV80543.1 tRNA(Ile)-lysidine synthetase [Mammaliicoccus stepanovicii]